MTIRHAIPEASEPDTCIAVHDHILHFGTAKGTRADVRAIEERLLYLQKILIEDVAGECANTIGTKPVIEIPHHPNLLKSIAAGHIGRHERVEADGSSSVINSSYAARAKVLQGKTAEKTKWASKDSSLQLKDSLADHQR